MSVAAVKDDPGHDACGVGFVAAENGVASNEMLRHGLNGLAAVEHRGGVAADGQTSDGAGVTIALDQVFFKRKYGKRGPSGIFANPDRQIAVGAFFMPRDDIEKHDRCLKIIKEELKAGGYYADARWREPKIVDNFLGSLAEKSHPRFYHLLIPQPLDKDLTAFDRDLYLMRRRIENQIRAEGLQGQGSDRFFVPSMSRHSIVYKSLSLGHNLANLYSDLGSKNYKTPFVVVHRRFSTNTAPAWERAHPYRTVSHNGEINSLSTNIEMFPRLEKIFAHLYGAVEAADILNVIQAGGTDSAMLDNAVEFLLEAGLSPPAVKSILVPEATMKGLQLPHELEEMYAYIDALVGPWDGPNTMIMASPKMLLIGGDRNGLRPIRYVRTAQGLIVAGSEDGMVQALANKDIIERGNLNPGGMLAVDLGSGTGDGRIMYDGELKAIAAKELSRKMKIAQRLENVREVIVAHSSLDDYPYASQPHRLRRLQHLAHFTQETVETFLDYMAQKGKEPAGSMGDDTPLTIASPVYRTLPNFFQQRFAQVTNPPLDSIRERASMSLTTYLGSMYDADGQPSSTQVLKLESPVLTNGAFQGVINQIGEENIATINCTFDTRGNEEELAYALERIRAEALAAAHAGKHIILTDENTDEHHAAIPMLLAAGAVNTHLSQKGVRGQTSLNIRSAESFSSHDMAAMIGLGGADTVNAYAAEETIAARHTAGEYTFSDEISSFDKNTTLENFFKFYTATGSGEADDRNQKRVDEVPVLYPDLIANFAGQSLGDLRTHPDQAVQAAFHDVMKKLDVQVEKVFEKQSLHHAIDNWKTVTEKALLKIMAKMGISHVASYRGGRLFEALGIGQDIIESCFPGVPSPVGGLGFEHIQQRAAAHHQAAFAASLTKPLQNMGRYKFRMGAGTEPHALTSELIMLFQGAVKEEDFAKGYELYRQYREKLLARSQKYRFSIRDWADFKPRSAIGLNEVERRENIIKRFFTGAMSDGSLGQQAHETLALAANAGGFQSNSGEGGEHPERYGTNKRSKVKQLASARFGVDLDYLLDADVIQIKIAQGRKPGEGGELDGKKVNVRISFLRKCAEGTTLISPAPHHDIYSIEDLEQLVYDLKQAAPKARVDVKLVASSGVDVIAAGVAKCGADSVHIAGFSGGSGNSPQLSFAHAGMPWEAFLAKTHQRLISEGFRPRIRLHTDGSLRMGRDIVMAAMLGAEDYGFGLQALIAEGCLLVRSCQSNTCPVGIATTDPELQKHFVGTPEMVIRMMQYIAEDVRETLASLGLKSIDEALGRTDLLEQVWGQDLGVDLSGVMPETGMPAQGCKLEEGKRNEPVNYKDPAALTIDQACLNVHGDVLKAALTGTGPVFEMSFPITNENRSVGARLSGVLRQHAIDSFGRTQPETERIRLNLDGVAGQSFGAFLAKGITLDLTGAANDGVGKSLSGGTIIIKPDPQSRIHSCTQDNVILGNAALYGAINGALFAAGRAGNRFAIRLSGATAVVEGAGTNACNYMTSGTAVILGEVGQNFGSGMSGGEAFVFDPKNQLEHRAHQDVRQIIKPVSDENAKGRLHSLVKAHYAATGSRHAQNLLDDWERAAAQFKHVKPPVKAKAKAGQAVTLNGAPVPV